MTKYFICDDSATRRRMAALLDGFTVAQTAPDQTVDLLIRWGSATGTDRAHWTVNTKAAVTTSVDPVYQRRILHTNRIPVASEAYTTARYRVWVFDLRTFGIARRTSRGWRLMVPHRKLHDILVLRSRYAVYALGLHAGVVDLGIGDGGRLCVLRVSPGRPLGRVMAQRLAVAIAKYVEERRWSPAGRNAVLGCDPEFMLRRRRTGRIVTANRFFPYRGSLGHDRLLVRRVGGRPLAELRPRPSPDPMELLAQLRHNMRRAIHRTGRHIEFKAGSLPFLGFPIGGHIHFSGVPLTTDFLRSLDIYLAIPLLLLDNAARSWRRRLRYGFLGDFRHQRHGGFEYRTLPSWILSPTVSLAVLCLAKTVAGEYHRLPRHILNDPELQQAFYSSRKEPFYRRFPEIWGPLEEVPTFRRYADQIRPLKQWIDARKTWPDQRDIKKRWLAKG